VELGVIPPPHPGVPSTIVHGPAGTRQVAWTVDDGIDPGCVASYVAFAQRSATSLTFNPNGYLAVNWQPHAPVLRDLIAAGQVQIGNHTFSHPNLLTLSDQAVADEIERNETWIENTFGVTARPWLRPPYGYHDDRTDAIAGELGYTKIMMWNGSFGDSTPISSTQLLGLAIQYLEPGTIMIGHANYPTIEPLFGQILGIIHQRGLEPVTLDQMFGTSRAVG